MDIVNNVDTAKEKSYHFADGCLFIFLVGRKCSSKIHDEVLLVVKLVGSANTTSFYNFVLVPIFVRYSLSLLSVRRVVMKGF